MNNGSRLPVNIPACINALVEHLKNKRLLLLGFGREGRSSYEFIRQHLPTQPLAIADQDSALLDKNPNLQSDQHLSLLLGDCYLDSLADFDLILKAPGVSLKDLDMTSFTAKITSQLELLLEFFPLLTIGITATKGKSTTSSLIAAILQDQGRSTFLLGNIGQPVFARLPEFTETSILVLEMSSHQLEFMHRSPHIALLLNLSEEHLDHYRSFADYAQAKCNIYRYQTSADFFLYNIDDPTLTKFIQDPNAQILTVSPHDCAEQSAPEADNGVLNNITARSSDFYRKGDQLYYREQPIYDINSPRHLLGNYNLANILFALAVAEILHLDHTRSLKTIENFQPLPHRLEFIGEFGGVRYYDNAIGTVPAATIAAIAALGDVDTLIIGGMDRGLDYSDFIQYLRTSPISHVICMPKTGHDIGKELPPEKAHFVETLEEAVTVAKQLTKKDHSCLLSPTAASYGFFKNFEEKGDRFQALVKQQP